MAEVNGGDILIKQLQTEGIDFVFNLPGEPNVAIYLAMMREGVRMINFRHEQGAAMAAQAYTYVTRKPAVTLVASGPAMTNAITGLATAWSNAWPFLLIAGSSDRSRLFRGDFQEMPQVQAAAPFCKWATGMEDPRQIPYCVHSAIERMMNGRPGPVYLDMPSNVIDRRVKEDEVTYFPAAQAPYRPLAEVQLVHRAVQLIQEAERPLLLMGKGVGWSDGGEEATQLVERLHLPFVPSPMGKGTIPDDHPLCVQGARTYALRNADLVVLAGARFNWIFHFGQPPRFAPHMKVVQIDIDPSEMGNGVPATVGLLGDAKAVLGQMLEEASGRRTPPKTSWLEKLHTEKERNAQTIAALANSDKAPMNMYRMYREIAAVMGGDDYVTADGETAMAVSRVMIPTLRPRHRLDAGVAACMGVALPYAIGTQLAAPQRRVFALCGDYALGWNAMEMETAVRNKLPIIITVANNVSVGGPQPMELTDWGPLEDQPEGIRYDKLMETFGGHAEHVERQEQLRPALERSLASGKPSLVNVVIDRRPVRKPQSFDWMTGRSDRMNY